MSVAFLSVSGHGSASGGAQAKEGDAQQLFDLLVFKPWAVLEFGGLEHCALENSGSEDADPESVAVRPLSSSPTRDAELARRLQGGTEVTADGKVCVNNAAKYGSHFLRFAIGTDERNAEYDALNHGDSSKLPEADPERHAYKLGVADKPATDAMEEGGQYQRLLVAIVVFVGELGAFCLLGALSVGVILAQVLLLLLLAVAPVALVAAAIPGPRARLLQGLAGEARRLPAAQGRLLAAPGDPAGGQRGARRRHRLARLADVLRPAGALLLGGLPAAQGAQRGPRRRRHRPRSAGAPGRPARARPLLRRPHGGTGTARCRKRCPLGRRRAGSGA